MRSQEENSLLHFWTLKKHFDLVSGKGYGEHYFEKELWKEKFKQLKKCTRMLAQL